MERLKQMQQLAIDEAKKLKKHATKEEIGNLNIVMLDPGDIEQCIYGQLTGDCYSARATELIIKCAKKVYSSNGNGIDSDDPLNGKPYPTGTRPIQYHSPIEVLILDENGGDEAGKKIISFLKDETKTLEFA